MNATELRAAITLAMVYVLRMLGLFMIMPVLAVLAQSYPDYSLMLVGVAIGGYGLTQALLQIPMGILSDKFGRKPIIIIGLMLFATGSLIAGLAESMWLLVLGRLLQGAGAIAGAIMALAADVSRESQRAKVMAIIGIAIGFSFYLALLVGPMLANLGGLSAIFLVTAVLALLCIPLVWFVVPDAIINAPSGDTLPVRRDLARLIAEPQLLRLNVSVCLLHMLITIFFMQIPIMLISAGSALDQHWQLYLPILLGSIVGLTLLMGLNRKIPRKQLMIASIGLLAIAFVGLASAKSIVVLCVFAMLFFSGFNYLEANLPAWVSSIAPAGKKGSAMGMFASFQFFGAFLGGTSAGLLGEFLSPQGILLAMLAVLIIWLLVLKGMSSADTLKRYSLVVDTRQFNPTQLKARMQTIAGIVDYSLVPSENAVYIKADQQFDLRSAQKILANE